MKTLVLSILYFLTGFFCIVLQNQSSFFTGFVTKALIIPVLIILFIANLRQGLNRLNRLMFAGLIFSWAGDVILEFSQRNGDLFILGLVCFLLAHIMYLTAFFLTPGENVIFRNRIYLLIPVLLYGVGLVFFLYNDLADLRLPVILYSIVILTMLAGAINRIEKVNRVSYFLVLAGAILFVISDSAIAINKFSYHFESSGIVIMSTYVIAQFLIVLGYIKQTE
ncbi:MAG: lysoplasmalogenase [Bacteroidia bacterium]|nr:lysoplasmalogenase [Bacteroidia bacterium]